MEVNAGQHACDPTNVGSPPACHSFVHTQWVDKLHPLIERVLNTPSHHRGKLIVLDRLFGTFVQETEAVHCGLVRLVRTHNPLRLTLHEWADMIRDVMRPGTQAADNRAHASESAPRPHDPAHP